ncbi:hypothetical protein N2152v2_009080 [Parachlorella kessleri]
MATADDEYAFLEQVEAAQANGNAAPETEAQPAERDRRKSNRDEKERDRSRERRKSSRDDTDKGRRRDREDDRERRKRRSRSTSRDRLVRRRDSSRERRERPEKVRERRDSKPRSRELLRPERPKSPPPRRERTPPEVRAARERERELRELDRDTRTVFAYNLNLRAEERDLFALFASAGPLVDIKIIRDKNSGRSKGFAYIEYERREDVINALALTGQILMGQAVMVKMSEAEKNLAWEAAEQQKAAQKALEAQLGAGGGLAFQQAIPAAGPCRLAVSNLHASITEADLQPIFEPFGALEFVTLQRDPLGRSTGVAFVQFRSLSDATKAMQSLDNMDIVGQQIRIQLAAIEANPQVLVAAAEPVQERLDADADDGGGLKLTSQARAALMSRLATNAGLAPPTLPTALNPVPVVPAVPVQPQVLVPSAVTLEQGLLGPASPIATQCLLLKNMFNPAEETEPTWDQDIAVDVKEECEKYGPVEHIHVDRNSQGFVYLKFNNLQSAAAAQRALHGRWFAGRQIVADFQFTPVYNNFFKI